MATILDGWAYCDLAFPPSQTIEVNFSNRRPTTTEQNIEHVNTPFEPSLESFQDAQSPAKRQEVSASGNSRYGDVFIIPSRPLTSSTVDSMSTSPFVNQHGRRYLRDPAIPYPLPVDLMELHRQSLQLLMLTRVQGGPFCSPFFEDYGPRKVLEVACGSALWSSACHDHFKGEGYPGVSFTGLDIAPLAPDLRKHGIDWRFVQHDLRKRPWPFPDGEFDMVYIKDMAFCTGNIGLEFFPMEESLRVLKRGGVLEVCETDYLLRCLLPYPSVPPGATEEDLEQAKDTATYLISARTGFAKSQNKFIVDCNKWVEKAFDQRSLNAAPCAFVAFDFSNNPDSLYSVGSRRFAVPLGEVRWEREGVGGEPARLHSDVRRTTKNLTADQAALRRTALMTIIQFIENLEPMLKEASGKRQDEWDRWWACLMNDWLEQNGTVNGECLEVGVWWARKR